MRNEENYFEKYKKFAWGDQRQGTENLKKNLGLGVSKSNDAMKRNRKFGYRELYNLQRRPVDKRTMFDKFNERSEEKFGFVNSMEKFMENLQVPGAGIFDKNNFGFMEEEVGHSLFKPRMEVVDTSSLLFSKYLSQNPSRFDETSKENRISEYQVNFSRQFSKNVPKQKNFYFHSKIKRERSRNIKQHKFSSKENYEAEIELCDRNEFEIQRKEKRRSRQRLNPFQLKNRNKKKIEKKVKKKVDKSESPSSENPESETKHQTTCLMGFAANTDQGIVRNYNEDRVSIILNIAKPEDHHSLEEWPNCCYFGVYDGHGGTKCADFLRDNLHKYVISDPSFPFDCRGAIKRGFAKAEKEFCTKALKEKEISGSCAVVVILVKDEIFIANVGDSRAVASYSFGNETKALSRDHKPTDAKEQQRISKAGGKMYRSEFESINQETGEKDIKYGPLRVLPGRLSVSRAFGDIEAKAPKMGGKQGVVVAKPEIDVIKITPDLDFIVLGSDGIFDKLGNEELVSNSWEGIRKVIKDSEEGEVSNQDCCTAAIESVMSRSLLKKTQDNISTVIISFRDFLSVNVERENGDILMKKLNEVLGGITSRKGNKRRTNESSRRRIRGFGL